MMNTTKQKDVFGGCLCGSVQYKIQGPLRDVVHCHCSQCTKLNGNFGSHSKAHKDNITIINDSGLSWYNISDVARRGFCKKCGSPLFWKNTQQDSLGIVAGSLNTPTELKTIGHIFVAEKSDFYDVLDDNPQYLGSSNGELSGDYL